MSMTSQVAVTRITRELKELENLLDLALAKKNGLVATFATARVDLAAPASSGQVAMMRLANVEKALVAARGDTIRAHEDLYRLGVERADVPEVKPPEGSLDRFIAELDLSQAA